MLRTKTREDQKSRSSMREKLKKKKMMMRQPWKRVPGASSTHKDNPYLESWTKKTKLLLHIVAKISKCA